MSIFLFLFFEKLIINKLFFAFIVTVWVAYAGYHLGFFLGGDCKLCLRGEGGSFFWGKSFSGFFLAFFICFPSIFRGGLGLLKEGRVCFKENFGLCIWKMFRGKANLICNHCFLRFLFHFEFKDLCYSFNFRCYVFNYCCCFYVIHVSFFILLDIHEL